MKRVSRQDGKFAVYELLRDHRDSTTVVGARYDAWRVIDQPWSINQFSSNLPLHITVRVTYGVLLPLLRSDAVIIQHTLVTKARD